MSESEAPFEKEQWILYQVAHMVYDLKLPQFKVAELLGISTAGISRLLKRAEDQGLVQFRVIEPRNLGLLNQELAAELKKAFVLKDVRVVSGSFGVFQDVRSDVTEESSAKSNHDIKNFPESIKWTDLGIRNAREAILDVMAKEAANLLKERLRKESTITLAIAWGRTMKSMASYVQNVEPMPGLRLASMIGVRKPYQADWFDANSIVTELAVQFGTLNYYCVPFPAVFESRDYMLARLLKESRLWTTKIEPIMDQVNIVITSLGAVDKNSSAVEDGLISADEVQQLEEMGMVGEICTWYFDKDGKPYEDIYTKPDEERRLPLGFGLNRLQKMVAEDHEVILVAGVTIRRVNAIYAALTGKLANVLVTDHVTAKHLLDKFALEQE